MAIGRRRTEGCDNPRRVRRGLVEPLCEECHCARPATGPEQLASEETAGEVRKRFRRFRMSPGQQGSAQQATATATGETPAADSRKHGGQADKRRGRPGVRRAAD
jgi:hypothetical protein